MSQEPDKKCFKTFFHFSIISWLIKEHIKMSWASDSFNFAVIEINNAVVVTCVFLAKLWYFRFVGWWDEFTYNFFRYVSTNVLFVISPLIVCRVWLSFSFFEILTEVRYERVLLMSDELMFENGVVCNWLLVNDLSFDVEG
jgi:hypothetical protein